jgi:hypothetical protein
MNIVPSTPFIIPQPLQNRPQIPLTMTPLIPAQMNIEPSVPFIIPQPLQNKPQIPLTMTPLIPTTISIPFLYASNPISYFNNIIRTNILSSFDNYNLIQSGKTSTRQSLVPSDEISIDNNDIPGINIENLNMIYKDRYGPNILLLNSLTRNQIPINVNCSMNSILNIIGINIPYVNNWTIKIKLSNPPLPPIDFKVNNMTLPNYVESVYTNTFLVNNPSFSNRKRSTTADMITSGLTAGLTLGGDYNITYDINTMGYILINNCNIDGNINIRTSKLSFIYIIVMNSNIGGTLNIIKDIN